MSRDEYARMERGEDQPSRSPADRKAIRGLIITPLERCILYRRRAGMTRTDLAHELGCSRYWVGQMELGAVNPQRLLDYWRVRRS